MKKAFLVLNEKIKMVVNGEWNFIHEVNKLAVSHQTK